MRSACVARGSFEVRVRRARRALGGAFDEAFVEESNDRRASLGMARHQVDVCNQHASPAVAFEMRVRRAGRAHGGALSDALDEETNQPPGNRRESSRTARHEVDLCDPHVTPAAVL